MSMMDPWRCMECYKDYCHHTGDEPPPEVEVKSNTQHCDKLFVVERGERNCGGFVVGLCRHWRSAKTLALSEKAHFGPWEQVQSEIGKVWEWRSGCDYVRITIMEVRG